MKWPAHPPLEGDGGVSQTGHVVNDPSSLVRRAVRLKNKRTIRLGCLP